MTKPVPTRPRSESQAGEMEEGAGRATPQALHDRGSVSDVVVVVMQMTSVTSHTSPCGDRPVSWSGCRTVARRVED